MSPTSRLEACSATRQSVDDRHLVEWAPAGAHRPRSAGAGTEPGHGRRHDPHPRPGGSDALHGRQDLAARLSRLLVSRGRTRQTELVAATPRRHWRRGSSPASSRPPPLSSRRWLFGVFDMDMGDLAGEVDEMGLTTPRAYLLGALGWTFANSLMEEYVYRWFVFSQCERLMPRTSRRARVGCGLHRPPHRGLEHLSPGSPQRPRLVRGLSRRR